MIRGRQVNDFKLEKKDGKSFQFPDKILRQKKNQEKNPEKNSTERMVF